MTGRFVMRWLWRSADVKLMFTRSCAAAMLDLPASETNLSREMRACFRQQATERGPYPSHIFFDTQRAQASGRKTRQTSDHLRGSELDTSIYQYQVDIAIGKRDQSLRGRQ